MAIQGALIGLRKRGTFNVEIKLEGEWPKYRQLVNSNNLLLAAAAIAGQRSFAEKYKKEVKRNILTGGKKFGYPPLSEGYKKFKERYGGRGTPLVWSKTFYNSVKVIKNKAGTFFGVGIPKGIKRPSYHPSDNNRLTVSEYANVLEHGSFPIYPRPVFKDTFKDMGGKKAIRTFIEIAIIKNYYMRGFRVNRI